MFSFQEPVLHFSESLGCLETIPVTHWIVDENILRLYGHRVSCWREDNVFALRAGEEWKTIESVQEIWHWFFEKEVSRDHCIGVVGGGMALDLGSFASSVWNRGVSVVLVPTTLLAQVDAAYGGKTGCNFRFRKNVLGTFYFSQAIWILTPFLQTLSARQHRSGIGEMVKHALLDSISHWEMLKRHVEKGFEGEWLSLIQRSIEVKMTYVREDPYEMKGKRSALNLGHTIGHALESWSIAHKYNWEHGECIFLGLIVELLVFHSPSLPVIQELIALYQDLHYAPSPQMVSFSELLPYLIYDKKRVRDAHRLVKWNRFGDTELFPIRSHAEWKRVERAYEEAIRWLRHRF